MILVRFMSLSRFPGRLLEQAQLGEPIDVAAGGAHMTEVALPPTPEQAVHPDQLTLRRLRSGDENSIAICNDQLDQAVKASRESRQASQQPRDPETGQFVGFDGGFRGRTGAKGPAAGLYEESASDLFVRALRKSLQEREESGQNERVVRMNV